MTEQLDDLDRWVKTTSEQVSDESALVSTMATKVTMPKVSDAAQARFGTQPFEDQAGYAQANGLALVRARKLLPEAVSGAPVTPELLDPIVKKKDATVRLRLGAEALGQDADDAAMLCELLQLCYCNLIAEEVAQMAAEGDPEMKQLLLSQTASIRDLEQTQKDKKGQQHSNVEKKKTKLEAEVQVKQDQADALKAAQAVRRGEAADPQHVLLAAEDLGTKLPDAKGKPEPAAAKAAERRGKHRLH